MNEMSKQWVVLGAFKLKEWFIYGDHDTATDVVAKLNHNSCDFTKDIDALFLPEILDIISTHECPIIYGNRKD